MTSFKPGLVGLGTSLGAVSCCVIPMMLIGAGIAGGAGLAAIFTPWNWLLFPIGWAGLALGIFGYFRKQRRCREEGCAYQGRRANLTMLVVSTVLMVTAGYFNWFVDGM